jgi:uncharacterized membrane protein YbhN (UPF0104 family)
MMRALSWLGLLLGAALLGGLLWSVRASLPGLLAVGLAPLAAATGYRAVTLALYARSWQVLLPADGRPRFLALLRLRWIGEAINALLPAAQVGGDLVRARLLARAGVPGAVAARAMVADLVTGAISQGLFTLLGLAALATAPGTAWRPPPAAVAVGLALLAAAGVALALLLRGGRRPGWAAALAWHLAGWLSQVGETWLVLALAGVPASWRSALVLESLSATARALAFVVPGGIGVQEGALVALGRMPGVGVPTEAALLLGLVKRLREAAVGAPGLVAWTLLARPAAPGGAR